MDSFRRVATLRVVLVAAGVAAAAYGAWTLWVAGPRDRSAIGLGGILACFVLAALGALRGARASQNPRGSQAWRVLATAWLLWAASVGLSWVHLVLRGTLPASPSVGDLLHLAGAMSFLWALGSYPVNPPERFGRIRELLDVAILTISVLGLTWLAVLRPVLNGLQAEPIELLWAGVRPAMDAVLLALVFRVVLLAGRPVEARPLWLLGAGILAILVGDLLMGYQDLVEAYAPGTALDLAWMVGGLAVAWAGLEMRQTDPWPASETRGKSWRRLEALLPIAFIYAVVGFTILDAWTTGSIDWAGVAVSIAVSVLLVARQGVVAGQSEMRQYASLLNASGDLAFICDGEGSLRLFNPAFVAAMGLEGSGARRHSLKDFLPGLPLLAMLAQAGSDGWTGEVSLQRRDGVSFPAMLTLRPVEGLPGPATLVAGTGVDLTDIKVRETELRSALHEVAAARSDLQALNVDLERKVEARTQQLAKMVDDLDRLNKELQELDKLKTEFVTLVSHELRAPLTNIRTGLELLLAGNPSFELNVRESLALVEEEAARLGRFVEAILDLSALEAGKVLLHPSPVSPWKAAHVAVDRFRSHPARDQMQPVLDPDLPDVLADERALGSVFFHLLDNAAKYGGRGPITIGARADEREIEIQIEDDGPGIPAAERDRVFDMFHRLDARDDREVYGHGLGLHLVKRMLEAMGGRIRAEAGSTGGTRMVFTLPRFDSSAGVGDLAAAGSAAPA
jgi:PAS domain S-box-containing protein